MRVQVGPFEYRVSLVHGYIQHEGQPCLGLCDHLRQQILLSDVPPPEQRLQVFFHELMHAWWYHFQVPVTNEEAVADLVGVAMTDFMLQALKLLKEQGATLQLLPLPAPSDGAGDGAGDGRAAGDSAAEGKAASKPGVQPRRAPLLQPHIAALPLQTIIDGRWTARIYG